jgi:hypothetical protein
VVQNLFQRCQRNAVTLRFRRAESVSHNPTITQLAAIDCFANASAPPTHLDDPDVVGQDLVPCGGGSGLKFRAESFQYLDNDRGGVARIWAHDLHTYAQIHAGYSLSRPLTQ